MRARPWLIATDAVDGAWPAVKHFVERALAEGAGRLSADDVLEHLRAGGMQLWALVTEEGEPEVVAVLVTEMMQYPSKRVLDLALMGGDHMEEWLDALPVLEEWARGQGIDQIQVHGRRGWKRVTGYPETAVVLVKDLGGDNGQ